MCFFSTVSFSQNLETVGAGVIDFLLSNPKTANNMNTTDVAALNIIGNLLKTAGERKHDVNVANASANKQQIILNDNSGRQATVNLDPDGNIYLLYNGLVYPINQSIVSQAKEEFVSKHQIKNEYLPPYDLDEIRENFAFENPKKVEKEGKTAYEDTTKYEVITKYKVTNKQGEYMSEIAKKLGLSVEDLKLIYYRGLETKKLLNRMKRDEIKAKYRTTFEFKETKYKAETKYEVETKYELETKIPIVFTCKWVKDFDDDGFDFDDFQGIKNSFSKHEKILFVLGYQTDNENYTYSLEIYEFETGNLLFRRMGDASPGQIIIGEEISTHVLVPGSYIFIFKLKSRETTIASKKERFEIRNE